MPATIPSGISDDNEFIEVFNSMLRSLVASTPPEWLWVIQIDNWFDHKWLKFSGIGVVDFPFLLRGRLDSALAEFYQDRVTFPPFAPNRVLGQWSFQRSGEDFVEVAMGILPHDADRRPSGANLQRRVEDFSGSAVFVWFSGNTLKNGRGSIMVYDLRAEQPAHWFAAFARDREWSLRLTKGISRDYVSSLMIKDQE